MKKNKNTKLYLLFIAIAILTASLIVGCDNIANPTLPTVSSTYPVDVATDKAINSTVTATFSEEMDSATIIGTNFTLTDGTTPVPGTVTYDAPSKVATLTPAANLVADTTYTATVTTGVTNLTGNALAVNKVWTFTTTDDVILPTISSTYPADSATGRAINSTITAAFSEAMDPATIVAANFTLTDGVTPVLGNVTYDIPNEQAIFASAENLVANTTYTATVTTSVTDLAGNQLAEDMVWTFTTEAAGTGPAPVKLGTAGNFVILAKTAISTVPASVITGDIGISPAAQTYITGFSQTDATGYSTSPQITGYIYAADMAPPTSTNMTTAIADMEIAYTDAAGRVTPDFTNLGAAGNIGGLTLASGLYTWDSNVTIPTNITISGNANDVWIFQISGNLTVSAAVNVTLSGGAKARNIFWQLSGAATMGANSHFEGIILSQTAITLETSASMNGRLLAQSNVALDQNTVTKPAL